MRKSLSKQGLGMGGGTGEGPGGVCVCVECGKKYPHVTGQPCNKLKCPVCGGAMTREVGKDAMSTADAGALVQTDIDEEIEPRYSLMRDGGPFNKSVFYNSDIGHWEYQIRFRGERGLAAGGLEKSEGKAMEAADHWEIVLMDRMIEEANEIRKGFRATADPQAREWIQKVLESSRA